MRRCRALITAGPTFEPIDAVRYLANRSSGQLGIAIAEAARQFGWDVTILLGPVGVPSLHGVTILRFESTSELEALLLAQFPHCDVLIMAAAVADYRPVQADPGKLSRMPGRIILELEPTPDLVAECAARRHRDQRIVAFALEEPALLESRALDKLRRKRVDAIVANPLATMGSPMIRATIYTARGEVILPAGSAADGTLDKQAFAGWLVDWIARTLLGHSDANILHPATP